jgi:hypothetical protein
MAQKKTRGVQTFDAPDFFGAVRHPSMGSEYTIPIRRTPIR